MLLQRLATGATGVKQARYRRGPTQALYAHAQYSTQCTWHLLFNAWCNEFRRGFCTLITDVFAQHSDCCLSDYLKVTII